MRWGVLIILLSTVCLAAAPELYYQDMTDGVISGFNQTEQGSAISIYGKNFGLTRGTSTITLCGVTLTRDKDFAEWSVNETPKVPVGVKRITLYLNSSMTVGKSQITVTTSEGTSNSLPLYCRENGTIYFLDPENGNDSYDGLYSSYIGGTSGPKRTTAWARGNLDSGDSVYLRAGVYNEHDNGSMFHYGGLFSFGIQGTPNHNIGYENNSITVTAYPTEIVMLKATDACNSGPCLSKCIYMYYAGTNLSYWTFSKLFMNASESAIQLGGNAGYVNGGTKNIRIVNVDATTIYDPEVNNGCIFSLYGSAHQMQDFKIFGNYLHDQLSNFRGQVWQDVSDEQRAYQIYLGGYGEIDGFELGWSRMRLGFHGERNPDLWTSYWRLGSKYKYP